MYIHISDSTLSKCIIMIKDNLFDTCFLDSLWLIKNPIFQNLIRRKRDNMSQPEPDTIMNDDVVVDVAARIRELAAFFLLIRIKSEILESCKECCRWVLETLDFEKCEICEPRTTWAVVAVACARAVLAKNNKKDLAEFEDVNVKHVVLLFAQGNCDIVGFRNTPIEGLKQQELCTVFQVITWHDMHVDFPWLRDLLDDLQVLHLDLTGQRIPDDRFCAQ